MLSLGIAIFTLQSLASESDPTGTAFEKAGVGEEASGGTKAAMIYDGKQASCLAPPNSFSAQSSWENAAGEAWLV